MNDNTIAIIQARLGSTRLSNKVLLPLGNGTVLGCVHDRVKRSHLIDKVIVATTTNPKDDELVLYCQEQNIKYSRGSEEDVLDRYYQTAKKHQPKNIVRITADCPLIDYKIIDKVINKHIKEGNDYTATAYIESFPDGQDVDVFTFNSLARAWAEAKLPFQREHITQYLAWNPELFKIGNLKYRRNLTSKRWVVDRPQDYQFMQQVYNAFSNNEYFDMEEILAYLSDHPEVEAINRDIIRNEGLDKQYRKKWLNKRKD